MPLTDCKGDTHNRSSLIDHLALLRWWNHVKSWLNRSELWIDKAVHFWITAVSISSKQQWKTQLWFTRSCTTAPFWETARYSTLGRSSILHPPRFTWDASLSTRIRERKFKTGNLYAVGEEWFTNIILLIRKHSNSIHQYTPAWGLILRKIMIR